MNRIKKLLLSYPKKSSTQIINKIKNYDIISFDIFDTLIKRDVYVPADVFDLVERYFNRTKEKRHKIYNYKKTRLEAERIAREKTQYEEILYDDIFFEIKDFDPEILAELKTIEIEIEKRICVASTTIKEVYDWCLLNHKKVYIVSDMYLPKVVVEEILLKNGFTNYEKLLISSEKRATKKNGTLYDYLLKSENGRSNKIIHLGDSIQADLVGSRKKKIDSYYISRYGFNDKRREQIPQTLEYRCLTAFIENRINSKDISEYSKFGFSCLGPVLLGFTEWLQKSLENKAYDRILFFSRDGYIMQKAFSLLYPKYRTEYIYVSRKSLRPVVVYEMFDTAESFCFNAGLGVSFTLREVINLFDNYLDIAVFYDFFEAQGYKLDEILLKKDFLNKENYATFFYLLKEKVFLANKAKKELVTAYLKSFDFSGNIAIIDIGWRANMQSYFEQALAVSKIDANVEGYFIGLNSEAKKVIEQNNLKSKGYLFNYDEQDSIRSFMGLFETCFLAPMGSTKEYQWEENQPLPKFEKYEYSGEVEEGIVNEIQTSSLKFVSEYNKSILSDLLSYEKDDLFFNMKEFGQNPTMKNIKYFGKIRYHDTQLYDLANPKSVFYYLINPKKFIKDFSDSRWKTGFLKKLIKLKLSYGKIYSKLLKR